MYGSSGGGTCIHLPARRPAPACPIERLAIPEHVIADHRYSERRADGLIGVDQSNFQYQRKTHFLCACEGLPSERRRSDRPKASANEIT